MYNRAMEKTKIIYYNSTLLKGGTDTYMLEVVRNIDKEKFEIDVIVKDGDTVDGDMLLELEKLGSKVFLAKGSFVKRMLFLRKFFKLNKSVYDVCHINATSQGTGIIAQFARRLGKIKKVIFHSHMGGNDNNRSVVDKIGAKLMFKHSTHFASCSGAASEFMFGKSFAGSGKVLKLNNAINLQKFKFNSEVRSAVRNELEISDDTFVIIHIGRFAPQKNHKRLVEIFAEVKQQNANSKLILIGAGDLLEETKQHCAELGIEADVMFLGLKNNVCDYMQAADCFVMPSVHEGLPIVAVEAQGSGLPCILSANISAETKLAENVQFLRLEDVNTIWAHMILSSKNSNRVAGAQVLKDNKFDSKSAIEVIEQLYLG